MHRRIDEGDADVSSSFRRSCRDRQHRPPAEILLPDWRSLTEEILRHGRGYLSIHRDPPPKLVERPRQAQGGPSERREGRGNLLASPQARQRDADNRASAFLFRDEPERDDGGPAQSNLFPSLAAAFRAGYARARPCRIRPSAEGTSKGLPCLLSKV